MAELGNGGKGPELTPVPTWPALAEMLGKQLAGLGIIGVAVIWTKPAPVLHVAGELQGGEQIGAMCWAARPDLAAALNETIATMLDADPNETKRIQISGGAN